jgi:hypothetical protein
MELIGKRIQRSIVTALGCRQTSLVVKSIGNKEGGIFERAG